VAWKKLRFNECDMCDFHTELMLFRAFHATAFLAFKSASVDFMYKPRYLKLDTVLYCLDNKKA